MGRVSQRLVVFIKELRVHLEIDQVNSGKCMELNTNNLSVQVLDQSKSPDDYLNPVVLIGGLKGRPPLRLNDGCEISTCSYLNSLGFAEILMIDNFKLQFDEQTLINLKKQRQQDQLNEDEFDEFMTIMQSSPEVSISTLKQRKLDMNVRHVILHLAKDSLDALKVLKECLENNLV